MIKINLGCGPVLSCGWENFDYGLLPLLGKFKLTKLAADLGLINKSYVVDWPKFWYFDIRRKLPYKDCSVDYIYCSHVLEHFEKYETESILVECARVLKDDGVMRIVLPNLQKMALSYKSATEFNRFFFGYDKDIKKFSNIFIRGHQWMYDEKSMVELLLTMFKTVKVKLFKVGEVPDLENLDLETHHKYSFYIEASKSGK